MRGVELFSKRALFLYTPGLFWRGGGEKEEEKCDEGGLRREEE